MSWITFAYSLPKQKSSMRVTVWRRLQRLGAISPAGNLYTLPDVDDCDESLQWLVQEVQHAGGQAVMLRCDKFEGMSDQAVIDLFCAARGKEYADIVQEVDVLEQLLMEASAEDITRLPSDIAKLRRAYADIAKIDYFNCPEGAAANKKIATLERKLDGDAQTPADLPQLFVADYQGKSWVTRPQPHVDRLSSIWLIKRFIDADAIIKFGKRPDGDISFDMPEADFGHVGNLCTFETLVGSFSISAENLPKLTEIIHAIDLNDGLYNHPEALGVDAVLRGWLRLNLSDETLVERGLALFDGLLASPIL